MKEMYLKVDVEDIKDIDFVDVFFRKGKYFTCPKGYAKLVEIEDAENKGAEKLSNALRRLAFFIKANGKDKVEELFGHANIEMILCEFAPHRIIELVKELTYRVPTVGDIYESRKSGNKVAVLSYNEETRRVRFMGGSYITNGSVEDFDKMFSFTGRGYNSIDNIANELYSEEGDNT